MHTQNVGFLVRRLIPPCVLKTLNFSLVLRICENSDVLNTLNEIYTGENKLEIKLLCIYFGPFDNNEVLIYDG